MFWYQICGGKSNRKSQFLNLRLCLHAFRMVYKRCAVEGCGRTKHLNAETTFFSFPTIMETYSELSGIRRELWLQRAKITEEQLMSSNSSLAICEHHFTLGKLLLH
ncbi:MAG: THAP domain-containing protein [Bacteroidota bacterium]